MAKRKGRGKSREPELVRRDGALSAVFVNTATGRRKSVVTYAEMVAWGRENGALGAAEAERLAVAAAERPADAAVAEGRMGEVLSLAERILLALARRRMPAAADLEALNAELRPVLAARHLVPGEGGFEWVLRGGEDGGEIDLEGALWPVLLSLADVLSSDDHRYVRQCDGRDCELVFVDRSPGRHRRWCSRKRCGDRTRALERYHREIKPRRRQRQRRASSFSGEPSS